MSTYIPRPFQALAHMRRLSGIAGRKLFAHSASSTDRRGSGEYVRPPANMPDDREYDAAGNELRRKVG